MIDTENRTTVAVLHELSGRLTDEKLVDEYFSIDREIKEGDPWPRAVWIACYAVTGGSEGHYIHVDLYMTHYGQFGPSEANVRHLACGKTFLGWEHAWKIAKRCAELLGS